ncbi:MAG: tRNA (adenosine(37)-N6)-threonylcarbamoyltransferase complex dimerization subunit type 1 TsaB [Treponema sp.]|nr:tRNA (adenosine(37)-N6)-threonylcarbamoyltransferase complex dimerization subunit type 1 TsaB [Treponema sp.]
MNLLAIDTASEKFSAAVNAGGETWLFQADAGLRHSELLMDGIDNLMNKAALQPSDLSGVLCMGGPGSFTGLRIGFSAAKGLALSLGIPFAPVPTLECMAWPFSSLPLPVMPVIDAKQGAFFCALFYKGSRLCPDMDAKPAAIAQKIADESQALLLGPGAALLHERLMSLPIDDALKNRIFLGKDLTWGNAETLLRIAHEKNIFSGFTPDYSSGPVYLRKSDAEK